MIPYILTDKSLTVVTTTKVHNIDNTHVHWVSIVEELKEYSNDIEYNDGTFIRTFEDLIDVTQAINTFGSGLVKVIDGVVTYKDTEVRGTLVNRMLKMMEEGFDVDPLVKFLENLMLNPSYKSREDLYRFLEANDLPITPDGFFLAYKNVNENYRDKHSGTFDNSIGKVCEMERTLVNDDSSQTCSAGLHVCSKKYLQGFWGTHGHTMIVKVNPSDVVSVPYDYNDSKMRTCKYEVVGEVEGIEKDFYDSTVHDTTDDGWISWDCAKYDIEAETHLSDDMDITVKLQNGDTHHGKVYKYYWGECGSLHSIVAYRVGK